jgi:ferric-dicitrate binding protein FerR (iron transport regulator)
MEEQIKHIDEIIIDCLTNEISDDDKARLNDWIAASDDNKDYFYRLEELWTSYIAETEDLSKFDKVKAFEQFKKKITAKRAALRKRRYKLLKYAAVACLFCAASFLAFKGGQNNVKSAFADIVIDAPQGSNIKMSLPDGTKVWLNAGSRMVYSQGFGVDDRKVKITGEGYFEVKKNPALPFNVLSDNIDITVLGTKFNFSDYPDDAEAIVSLNEGKVMLKASVKEDKYYLKPNQRAIFNKKTGEMVLESCSADNMKQWTGNRMVFNGEKFSRMARKLERSYDVKINLTKDSIKNLHFYGEFATGGDNIRNILNNLSSTGKFRYRKNGQNITIY